MPKMEMVKGASNCHSWIHRSKHLIIFDPDAGLDGWNGIEQRDKLIHSLYFLPNFRIRSELKDDFLEVEHSGKFLRVYELLAIQVYDFLHDILSITIDRSHMNVRNINRRNCQA